MFNGCLARRNDTLASTTDPDARLFKKSQGGEAHLAYLGHALTENRYSFAVAATVTHATGTAAREAALALMDKTADPNPDPARTRRRTLGADRSIQAQNQASLVVNQAKRCKKKT